MKVVTNAGPLMALGKLGALPVLEQVYGPVLLPAAVHEEVVILGQQQRRPDAYAAGLAIARNALVVVAMADAEISPAIARLPIDRGEKQAIQLGLQVQANWVLLDDALAREKAQALGLKVKGTLGVLVEAHRRGIINGDQVDVLFQAILSRQDIWISDTLVRRVWDSLRKR